MASPGVYIFTRKGGDAYVGRGDKDGVARMRRSHKNAPKGLPYDHKARFIPTSSARKAYLLECKLFHELQPLDNDRHPAVPAGTNWRCPVKGCRWS
jgi:hypothetical protein